LQHFRKWKLFSFNQDADRTIRTEWKLVSSYKHPVPLLVLTIVEYSTVTAFSEPVKPISFLDRLDNKTSFSLTASLWGICPHTYVFFHASAMIKTCTIYLSIVVRQKDGTTQVNRSQFISQGNLFRIFQSIFSPYSNRIVRLGFETSRSNAKMLKICSLYVHKGYLVRIRQGYPRKGL